MIYWGVIVRHPSIRLIKLFIFSLHRREIESDLLQVKNTERNEETWKIRASIIRIGVHVCARVQSLTLACHIG